MSMVVNHNIPALQTYNTVNRTNAALQKSIQKLSTGLRINSAADDAAGLAISEKMRAQISGLDKATSNAQDGISMIQTAEGALNETHSILQRMRELSVQAANDTLTSQDRSYIQLEIDELRDEVTRIGNTTQFNKKKLLNGDAAVLWSSDNLETKAIVNGGLRSIDQFGQKVVTEGNYKIKIKATAGQGEVQKSDLFKVKHENVVMNKALNKELDDLTVNKVPAGHYTVKTVTTNPTEDNKAAVLTGQYNIGGEQSDVSANATATSSTDLAASNVGKYYLAFDDGTSAGVKLGNATGNVQVYETTNAGGTKFYTLNSSAFTTDTQDELMSALVKDAFGVDGDKEIELSDKTVVTVSKTTKTDSAGVTTNSYTFKAVNANGKEVSGPIVVKKAVTDSSGATTYSDASSDVGLTPDDDDPTMGNFPLESIIKSTVKSTGVEGSASVAFEVTNIDRKNGIVELSANANVLKTNGTNTTSSASNILLTGTFDSAGTWTADKVDVGKYLDGVGSGNLTMELNFDNINLLNKGSKFVYNITKDAGTTTSNTYVQVSGSQNDKWPENWTNMEGNVTRNPMTYTVDASQVAGKDVSLKNFYLNEKTGELTLGEVILHTDEEEFAKLTTTSEKTLATFDAAYVGQVAQGDVALRDLDKFWTSEGVFMLDDPQTLTITQGDGKQTSVTLYATDTLASVAEKMNSAIATGLGQAQYLGGDDVSTGSHFVNYVESDTGVNSESVQGTFLIRSVVPGSAGALSFSGSENIINAFSLNTIQDAKESTYVASIEDAHSGAVLANNVKVTGNKLVGVIDPNVDVQFDAMAGVTVKWDDTNKKFSYTSAEYETTLHLSDNTTVFQIGANEGEDMGIHIGDMRATALGLDSVNVTNRESASRSITILDNAIDKVSTQRAKLGAYQNRLEHTINNLNTASENVTAAESRIRDTDMAKEMMNFTKLQIMLQAGTSMLAQANQLPQNVMSLVR